MVEYMRTGSYTESGFKIGQDEATSTLKATVSRDQSLITWLTARPESWPLNLSVHNDLDGNEEGGGVINKLTNTETSSQV